MLQAGAWQFRFKTHYFWRLTEKTQIKVGNLYQYFKLLNSINKIQITTNYLSFFYKKAK
jgi:hypothetical protein